MSYLIYREELNPSFKDFGIDIPMKESRYKKSFDLLASHEQLGPLQNLWHYDQDWSDFDFEELSLAHTEHYLERLQNSTKEVIFETYQIDKLLDNPKRPLEHMLKRMLGNVQGTLTACNQALDLGLGYFMGGGMHHAFSDRGQGFCLVNDVVLAIRKLQKIKKINKALIIDLDAHKGDGSAEITQNDPSIFTMSIHMAKGWPLVDPYSPKSYLPSDLDIPVSNSQEYLEKLRNGLLQLPLDVDICLVVSGADPYELDELESTQTLQLSLEQMMQRDLMVYNFLKENSIKQAYCMAGGYGENTWKVYYQFLEYLLLDQLKLNPQR